MALLAEWRQAREEELLPVLVEVVDHDFSAVGGMCLDCDPSRCLELRGGDLAILFNEPEDWGFWVVEIFHRDKDVGPGLIGHVQGGFLHQLVAGEEFLKVRVLDHCDLGMGSEVSAEGEDGGD